VRLSWIALQSGGARGKGLNSYSTRTGAMTRFVVMVDDQWVTAVYESGSGIGLTGTKEDASSWVTYEKAVAAARVVAERTNSLVAVHSVEEPAYPRSWN